MTRVSQESFARQRASQQNSHQVNFRDDHHASHVQALGDWLHPDLRDLPGIDWSKLSSRVIRTLVSIPGDSPHAPHIALATGTAIGVMGASSLRYRVSDLHALLSFVRTHCATWDGTHLTKEVWEEYVSKTEATSRRRSYLLSYSAVTERHLADYVERLDPAVHARITPYILPRLPARFLEQYGRAQEITAEQRQRRKERSDVLAPLHSILVALIQFRKQAAQRLRPAFREACARAEAGEALPLPFTYEDVLPRITRDAKTVAEVQVEKRSVVLAFTLWNRQTWVQCHPDEVSRATRHNAKGRKKNYRPEREQQFVEFLGDSADLLWFGDLVANGLVMHLAALRRRSRAQTLPAEQLRRLAHAQALGATKGFYCERPGLFTPAGGFGQWLAYTFQRTGVIIFDPESLYRACLFGAALATLALTNGSRVTELLQVSADRFKGHPYEEKINGQTTGKQRVIWLQYLLPKGKKTEAERQLFPISPQSYEFLREECTNVNAHADYAITPPLNSNWLACVPMPRGKSKTPSSDSGPPLPRCKRNTSPFLPERSTRSVAWNMPLFVGIQRPSCCTSNTARSSSANANERGPSVRVPSLRVIPSLPTKSRIWLLASDKSRLALLN